MHYTHEEEEARRAEIDAAKVTRSSARAPSKVAGPLGSLAVANCSALRWAVFPCGWKWEIASMTRENETPVAIFEHKHHAESFCREWWPQLGEVRSWPNKQVSRGAQPTADSQHL